MIRLHRCTANDLPTLTKISRETFVTAFEKDNNPDDFAVYVAQAFSSKTLKEQLEDPDTLFYFVYDEHDVLVGYVKINQNEAQTELKEPTSVELERIYVLQQYQGKNIGSELLRKVIELAQTWKKRALWLGVWEHNPRAIRFYQRHGFVKFGEHPYFIGNDEQTDWLMRLQLN